MLKSTEQGLSNVSGERKRADFPCQGLLPAPFYKLTKLCLCLLKLSQLHSLGLQWHPEQKGPTTCFSILKSSRYSCILDTSYIVTSLPICRNTACLLDMRNLTVHCVCAGLTPLTCFLVSPEVQMLLHLLIKEPVNSPLIYRNVSLICTGTWSVRQERIGRSMLSLMTWSHEYRKSSALGDQNSSVLDVLMA